MATPEDLRIQEEINRLERERAGISQDNLERQQNISNFLQQQLTLLRFEKAEKAEIRSLTRQLNKVAAESAAITLDELGSTKSLAKIQKDRQKVDQALVRLVNQRNKFANKEGEANRIIKESLDDQIDQLLEINAELQQAEENSRKIADNLGVKTFTAVEDLTKSIPGLRKFSEPFSNAANAARKAAIASKTSAQAFAAGAKALGGAALRGGLLLLLNVFLSVDKTIGNIGKNLGISYNQSRKLTSEFNKIATSGNSIFVTTENLAKAFIDINNSLGTNARLNEDLLITQTKLVQQAGYSVEAATQLSQLSLATGESSENITTEFLGQVKALNLQNNLAVNEKALLNSIANTSKGTLATFAGQTDQLARAAFQARKVGLELSQIEGIADNLLDIESSIAAEFEAEVISGRQLNLERARFFALTNDLEGLGRELEQQDITRANFQQASRIEQDAIAKSLGLSRDALGSMLIEQDALNALQNIEGKTGQERFNNLVKEVGLEEAKRRLGDETLANQLASVSTQEAFLQSINKLKEVFVTLVDPLVPVLKIFGDIFSVVAKVVSFLSPIIPGLMLLGGIATLNPALITLGAIGFGKQIISDGIAPASKGPFTITDSFGATAITSKGDGLAVSPNITREDRNTPSTIVLSDAQINKIANAVRDGASRATINLDGDRVSSRLQTPGVINQRQYSI